MRSGLSVPCLDQRDVSYSKIVELLARLTAATQNGAMTWSRSGDGFSWAARSGVVSVSSEAVAIYDENGTQLRRFSSDDGATLYRAALGAHEVMVARVIKEIMADLEAFA